jgi:hypothetical protein
MIILATTASTLEVATAVAGSVDVSAAYVDINGSASPPTFLPAAQTTNITAAATTTVVSAPATSTQRQIKVLHIANKSTSSQSVAVQTNVSGTQRAMLVAVVLASSETLQYVDGQGFSVLDPFAARKTNTKALVTNAPTFAAPWNVANSDETAMLYRMLAELRIQNFLFVQAMGLDIDLEQLRIDPDFTLTA